MSSITVITCTGDRHAAFEICKANLKAQTMPRFDWLVVDDGETIVDTSGIDTYIRQPHQPGVNTLKDNFTLALKSSSGDYIVVVEDDDFYSPNYVERMVEELEQVPVVGVAQVNYYHLAGVWRPIRNNTYAPLAFTAFHRNLIPLMLEAMEGGPYKTFDIGFWRLVAKQGIKYTMVIDPRLCTGVKGFPGRPGIGMGHRNIDHTTWRLDIDFRKAKELFGDSYELYMPFLEKNKL